MAISDQLFTAILAMDAYNRGYGAGLGGLSDAKDTAIGSATISKTSAVLLDQNGNPLDAPAGFYAIAYDWNGQKVISYRGTDNTDLFRNPVTGASDILNGWVAAAGQPTSQTDLALEFYKAVAGKSVYEGKAENTIVTGHSLGGGLAGANDDRLAKERIAA